MDSVLRPRDIQARIRAGETPETVAGVAQTTVEAIMGFATPVLAERAYQAQLAQRASVRRRAATGHVANLGAAVTSHLQALQVDPEQVDWDSWRREDGRWTVVAAYDAGGRQHRATFTYDAAGRFVVADDDEARALVGEAGPAPSAPPQPDAVPAAPDQQPSGDQLSLGDDALEVVAGRRRDPVAADEPEQEETVDLGPAAAPLRSAAPVAADADWIATQASARPDAPPAPAVPAEDQDDAPEDAAPQPGGAVAGEEQDAAPEGLFEVPAPARPASRPRPRARASVPSWDEIMFGTPPGE